MGLKSEKKEEDFNLSDYGVYEDDKELIERRRTRKRLEKKLEKRRLREEIEDELEKDFDWTEYEKKKSRK